MNRRKTRHAAGSLVAAYFATGSKLAAWLFVLGGVWRLGTPSAFAVLLLIRSVLGLLNYTTFGLAPAALRATAEGAKQLEAANPENTTAENADPVEAQPVGQAGGATLAYADASVPKRPTFDVSPGSTPNSVLDHVLILLLLVFALGLTLASLYGANLGSLHQLPRSMNATAGAAAVFFGLGVIFRLAGDAVGAVSQGCGYFRSDQILLAATEWCWVIFVGLLYINIGVRAFDL
ncbi:MAG: hypothetical protein AAGK78_08055, partial [Planctomycetota bacterium]